MTPGRQLNIQQLKAVTHKGGPLLVIAGAGTGKTTVITERIKYLIGKGVVTPEEILALTFTEKASEEMQERVDIALPLSYGEMWISTFHSFCDRVLRENAIHVGLSPNYKLMSEAESIDLIRRNLFEFDLDYFRPLGNPNKFISGLLQHFSRLQDETITPDEYLSWSKKINKPVTEEEKLEAKKWKELASVYKSYDEIKIKEGKFDFGDLVIKTLELFQKRPNILKQYQKKFKFILIDEFQDTNYAQNQIAILLAGDDKNITVVCDDDQAIYRWRGASVSNVIQFKKNFPKTEIIVLSENYRSRQEILDKSYQLIQQNNPSRLEVTEGINKKLIAKSKFDRGEEEAVKLIHRQTVDEEVEEIGKTIEELAVKQNYKWKDIAVLVRANNHADPLIREFERRGIPHQFLGPSKLFEKEEIVDLISYLKVLQNVHNNGSVYRLLSSDIFSLDQLDLIQITNYARKNSLSIYEVITEFQEEINISDAAKDKINELISILDKHLKVIRKETAGAILLEYIKDIGINGKIWNEEDEVKAKNIGKFFEKIRTYENDNKNTGVLAVVDYIDLLTEIGETPIVTEGDWQGNNAVNILTVHSSKGLEFKVVFLINLVSLRFPSTQRSEQIPIPEELIKELTPKGDFHLQEERRLFYVGMTRAKEKLYLTAADYYSDAKRAKKISPFIFEALGKLPQEIVSKKKLEGQLLKLSSADKIPASKEDKKGKIKIDYLSVSQIETFQICPLHYKLRYIYNLPTEPTASISFGISIHCALRDFYQEIRSGAKASEKLLISQLEKNWLNAGYSGKKHKQQYWDKGLVYLKGYYKIGFDKNVIPELMENKFNLNLGNNLKIGGTFDRVDRLGGELVEIVDYKTGEKVPTQKDADKDLQLGVYALAATKIQSELFNKKPEQVKLSLYYFEGQQKITTTRSKKQLEALEKELFEIRDEIENSDFKCSNHYFCQNKCEYSMFCK